MYHNWLRSFCAVARAGGFTAAGRLVGVSQSTITAQVRALEDQFKVELFYRRGRQVEISEAGRELLEIAQEMFGHEKEAIRYLTAVRDFQAGQFKIGAITPVVGVELMDAFHKRFPKIRVDLSLGHADQVLRGLVEFRTDVVILSHAEKDPRYDVQSYKQHRIVAIVHTDHSWAKRRHVRVKDLIGQNIIMREQGATTQDLIEKTAKMAGIKLNAFMEINSREGVCQAVARGLGIGLISEIEFIPLKNLKPVEITDPDMHVRFYIHALASRRRRPLINAFFEISKNL